MIAKQLAERNLQAEFILQSLRNLGEEERIKAHLEERRRAIGLRDLHAGKLFEKFSENCANSGGAALNICSSRLGLGIGAHWFFFLRRRNSDETWLIRLRCRMCLLERRFSLGRIQPEKLSFKRIGG